MGERERFRDGPAVYPRWLWRIVDVEQLIAGRSVSLRTYLPHRYETLKYISKKEPFAVVLYGVFYSSMARAAVGIGSSPHKIHLMAGKIANG